MLFPGPRRRSGFDGLSSSAQRYPLRSEGRGSYHNGWGSIKRCRCHARFYTRLALEDEIVNQFYRYEKMAGVTSTNVIVSFR